MPVPLNRQSGLHRLRGGSRGSLKRKLKAKKINYTKFFVRHFGRIPYFDVETGKVIDLRLRLDTASRKPGISGFMRLKNEEQFVEKTIKSVIDSLDELVIVHNGCSDRTPEIIESCRLRYPDRIRIFEYGPRVFAPGSVEHLHEPMGSPHSLVNYSNYALQKTTRKVAIKIDGDEVYFGEPFKQLADNIRGGKQPIPIGISGVNLWDEMGEIRVNAQHAVLSGLDKGFFAVSRKTFFVHYRHYELFTHAFESSAGILFYHLKGLKKDRGLSNYNLHTGVTTFASAKVARLKSPALIPLKDFIRVLEDSKQLPDPETMGIRARQNPGK